MFGTTYNKTIVAVPPDGVSALGVCILNEKFQIIHCLRAGQPDEMSNDVFRFLEPHFCIEGNAVLLDAFRSKKPVSLVLSYGEGRRKYLYILPCKLENKIWHFACLQVETPPLRSNEEKHACISALAEERMCLVFVDSRHRICSVGSRIPPAFGYVSEDLVGTNLKTLFMDSDFERILVSAPDTLESIQGCAFSCLDGSWREVEIKKFSAPNKCTLYGICDVSPRQRLEEFTEVTARERRRIGQDLHDSTGQVLTGMSLLSRSLANTLQRDGHSGSHDAVQISELADKASNQIRQISRGLMPSEIVQHGLYASLRELARITTGSCSVRCETQLDDSLEFADVVIATHLYRIAQEAVNNAVRHATASQIDIIVSKTNSRVQLNIVDDGRWVESEENVVGIGLKTMEYRALAIGGRLHISTSLQSGTRVTCRMEHDDSLVMKKG